MTTTPEGIYTGTLQKHYTRTTSSGKPYVEVDFLLDSSKVILKWKGFFSTDKSKALAMRTLKFLGMQGDNPEVLLKPDALKVGLKAELVVKHNDYQGQTYEQIQFVQAIGDNARWLAGKKAIADKPEAESFKDALNNW